MDSIWDVPVVGLEPHPAMLWAEQGKILKDRTVELGKNWRVSTSNLEGHSRAALGEFMVFQFRAPRNAFYLHIP